jgi:hypothetical protein
MTATTACTYFLVLSIFHSHIFASALVLCEAYHSLDVSWAAALKSVKLIGLIALAINSKYTFNALQRDIV